MVGRHILQLFPELPKYRRLEAARAGRGDGLEGLARRQDGAAFPVEVSLRPTVVEDEHLLIAIVRDITAAKVQENRLPYQAVRDALTGLPNRVLLHDRLAQALRSAAREGKPLSLMLIDLDRFKEINDTLGHSLGDLLLMHFGPRLRAASATRRIVRLGGDEFAMLLPAASTSSAPWPSERIVPRSGAVPDHRRHAAGDRREPGHRPFPDWRRPARLLQSADVAMYSAKKGGGGPIQLYDRDQEHVRRLR